VTGRYGREAAGSIEEELAQVEHVASSSGRQLPGHVARGVRVGREVASGGARHDAGAGG
jgi:hypothetical protein